jgi:endonuclease III
VLQLQRLVRVLRQFHGRRAAAPPVRDPYRLILLEQVAYLADDATRIAAFRLLESLVGTEPEAIIEAPMATLKRVTRAGGPIAFELRAKRLRFVAERVLDKWEGNLKPVLKLPFEEARRELMRYPTIGKPGAERILLLSGAHARLALDSNAMRVLLRLGYGRDLGRYDKTYDDVQGAAEREIPATVPARRTAHLVLRAHGQTLCRRSKPQCRGCPVRADCPTGRPAGDSPR